MAAQKSLQDVHQKSKQFFADHGQPITKLFNNAKGAANGSGRINEHELKPMHENGTQNDLGLTREDALHDHANIILKVCKKMGILNDFFRLSIPSDGSNVAGDGNWQLWQI
jgi:hypothetical protein